MPASLVLSVSRTATHQPINILSLSTSEHMEIGFSTEFTAANLAMNCALVSLERVVPDTCH